MSAERESYIDILRLAACLFVILLHCISGRLNSPTLYGGYSWEIFNVLNAFCRAGVPLFFMISGYLTLDGRRAESFSEFYKSRAKRLLTPLILWNAAYYLYFGIVWGKTMSFGGFLTELVNEGSAYHLWFMYTMLALSLAAPFLKIITDKCSDEQLFGLFLLAVFPSTIRPFINLMTGKYIYLFDNIIGGYAGYYILGLIIGRHSFSRRGRTAVYICGMIGALICIIGNRAYSSADGIELVFNGGYSINNYLVSAALFVFAKGHLNVGARFADRLSDCTFGVYLMHVMVMDIFSRVLILDAGPTVTAAVYFVCTGLVSFVVMLALNRIKNDWGLENGFL